MAKRNNWAIAALFLVCSWATNHSQQAEVIKFDTALVSVNVAVTDSKGRHFVGLKPEDFQVTDEGQPVQTELFDHQGPASIVFLVDTSASMRVRWQQLMNGLKKFLSRAHEDNDYTLITFNQTPRLVGFALGPQQLWQLINEQKPNGDTALYDALLLGLDTVQRVRQRHKALVLVSDGADSASKTTLLPVEQEAVTRRATIYSVGIFLYPLEMPEEKAGAAILKQLSAATGGLAFFPEDYDVHKALDQINTDLRGQYTLGYYPQEKTPGRRTISVSVPQATRSCKVRYQQTYLMK